MQTQRVVPSSCELLALNVAALLYAAMTAVGGLLGIFFNVLMPGMFAAREGASVSSDLKWTLAGQSAGIVLACVPLLTGLLRLSGSTITAGLLWMWAILQTAYTALCIAFGDNGAAAHPASAALLLNAHLSSAWAAVVWGIVIPLAGLLLATRLAIPDEKCETPDPANHKS